ncbi:uncharacterized protein LOC121373355 [Gigantopelta aegis]|uniref:uncharacterized protein LOC121373355 n=1 Tax=Gigantopelta aegis TaxID=1735272 RepID=UPI001B8885B7|nr:uncharacterized protein LOC121373355 [Gigantopelta aegis]
MELRMSRYKLVLLFFVCTTSSVMFYLLRVMDTASLSSKKHVFHTRRPDRRRLDVITLRPNQTTLKIHLNELVSSYGDEEDGSDDNYSIVFDKKPDEIKWMRGMVKGWKAVDFHDVDQNENTDSKLRKETKTERLAEDNTNIWGKTVIRTKQVKLKNNENNKDLIFPEPLKDKYLIYICDGTVSCGGWGDRQRGMIGAFLLAVVTRRRFGIKMTSPCELENFYEPNLVNWTISDSIFNDRYATYINSIDDSDFRFSLQHLDFNEKFPQNVVFIRNNVDFVPALWKNLKYRKHLPNWAQVHYRSARFSKAWKILFKPSWRIQQKYDDVMSQFDQSMARKLVCAHIRIGKNPTIPEDQNQRNPIPSVYIVWHFLSKYIKTPNTRVFIATDAEQVREMAKEEFNADLLTVGGIIRHIDRQRNLSDACDGFETALLEQKVLIDCDVLVTSESGFSILAADIRNSNKELYRLEDGHITPYKMI